MWQIQKLVALEIVLKHFPLCGMESIALEIEYGHILLPECCLLFFGKVINEFCVKKSFKNVYDFHKSICC